MSTITIVVKVNSNMFGMPLSNSSNSHRKNIVRTLIGDVERRINRNNRHGSFVEKRKHGVNHKLASCLVNVRRKAKALI